MWFGAPSATTGSAARGSTSAPADALRGVVERLKVGDFSASPELPKLLLMPMDEETRRLGIRVFTAVATHEDIRDSRRLDFLASMSELEALTFGGGADEILSYEILPYLFALAEEWAGTEVEEFMRGSIDRMVDYESRLGEGASLDQISELVRSIVLDWDHSTYYLRGAPAHPAPLCKELSIRAASATITGERLNMYKIPALLSVWSGVLCPVDDETMMTQDHLGEVLQYIKALAERDWVAGAKYFYGHRVG